MIASHASNRSSLCFPRFRALLHGALGLLAALVVAVGLAACQPAGTLAPEPTLVVEGGRVIVGDGNPLDDLSALDRIDVVVQGGGVVAFD